HGFRAIKDACRIVAVVDEGLLEGGLLESHGDCRGTADDFGAIESHDDDGLRTVEVCPQILALVLHRAVVQVRKVAKHGDAQLRYGIDVRAELRAAEPPDRYVCHACSSIEQLRL